MDAELEFAIQPNTTGKQLFDQVSVSDITTDVDWLLLSKKLNLLKQPFGVRSWPWVPTEFTLLVLPLVFIFSNG